MHEHFQPGRKTGLKLLIDQPGRSLELYFYLTARLDGKTKRIEKMVKKYWNISRNVMIIYPLEVYYWIGQMRKVGMENAVRIIYQVGNWAT